jgi:hypothetical protein
MSDLQRHLGARPYLLADHTDAGYNQRMTDLQAALGAAQMERAADIVAERQATFGLPEIMFGLYPGMGAHALLSRKLGREAAPSVIIRSYDSKRKRTIEVEHPPRAGNRDRRQKDSRKSIPSATKTNYSVYNVHGIFDTKALQRIAEEKFEALGRSERTTTIRTRELVTNEAIDLSIFQIEVGDPVLVEFEDFNREFIANQNVPEESKKAHLIARGYNEAIAAAIIRQHQRFQILQRPQYLRSARFDYSATDGVSIEIELVDFMVIDGDRENGSSVLGSHNQKLRRTDGSVIGGRL